MRSSVDSWQVIFFLLAALLVLLKGWLGWRLGLVRQFIGLGALVCAYLAAIFGGHLLVPIFRLVLPYPEAALAVLGGAILGFAVFVTITVVSAILFKKTSEQSVGVVRMGYGAAGAGFGAIYGLFIVWIAILAIRLLGSVAESQITTAKAADIEQGKSHPSPESEPAAPSAMVRGIAHMKHSLEQGTAGAMVQQVDPIPGTLYSVLAKLGLMVSDEKSVNRFLAYPGAKTLLAHPKIAALQNDPEITRDILSRNYFALIRNGRIVAAANDAEIGEMMRKFQFEKALDYALHKPEKDSARHKE